MGLIAQWNREAQIPKEMARFVKCRIVGSTDSATPFGLCNSINPNFGQSQEILS
jgi:hypothetical protein